MKRVCRSCGGDLSQDVPVNQHICADCERLLEDDSPLAAASAANAELKAAPAESTPPAAGNEVVEKEPHPESTNNLTSFPS